MIIASIDRLPIVRKGLGIYLRKKFDKVTVMEAESCKSFEARYSDEKPDLIIMGFTEKSGIKDCAEVSGLKSKFPDTPVIVYDGEPRFNIAVSCLAAGALGYLVKNAPLKELLVCIRTVLNGKRYVNDELVNTLLKQCYHALHNEANLSSLNINELKTAELISKGLTNFEIADLRQKKVSTISKQRSVIYKKLNLSNVIELTNVISSRSL